MAHRCPVFLGYFLLFPLRKFYQNPEKILGPYLRNGMKVLEIGPGMGFFTLPMARMTGVKGNVICVDIQERMIRKLRKRAVKAGLSSRIETRVCSDKSLGIDDLKEQIDFALAFAVVHEIKDPLNFFKEIYLCLKPGSILFISEPRGHCSQNSFDNTLKIASNCGFKIIDHPEVKQSRSAILRKDENI
jgi:ubiquinone/menaquinone biosynthesis C-methylase UbiE